MQNAPAGVSLTSNPESVGMTRRRLWSEILIVLGLSLGASAITAIVIIIDRITQPTALSQQTATIVKSLNERQIFDLTYQLLAVFFGFMPVLLVAFLLWRSARPHLGRLGIDFRRPVTDALSALALVLIIGIPGIGLYVLARSLGLNATVNPEGLPAYWWTIPVLVLRAILAGVTEEVIVIGYLFSRLTTLGYRTWTIIVGAALLRGTYHLYQGFGAFIGNIAMGVLFGWLYTRYGRLLPLVIAHTLIDVAVFVGYPWAAATFTWL